MRRWIALGLLVACGAPPPPPPKPLPVATVTSAEPAQSVAPAPEPAPASPTHAVKLTQGVSRELEAHDPVDDETFVATLGIGLIVEETAPEPGSDEAPEHGAQVLGSLTIDGEVNNFGRFFEATAPSPRLLWPTSDWRLEILELGNYVVALDRGTDRGHGEALRVVAKKGEPVEIGGGHRFVFEAHGHKKVAAGGPSSPLLVAHHYLEPDGTKWPEDRLSLREGAMWWVWRGHFIRVERYEYGDSMTLAVQERVFVPAKVR